jgi:predicted glycosyltransferase
MSQKDQETWLDIGKQYTDIVLIPAESPVDTYALIDASNITITSSSVVGIESVYWGTPCITIGPNMYSKLNCTFSASCNDQLIQLLSKPSLPAYREKTYPFGFFVSTMGRKYKFYKPHNLWRGEFLGVNLFQYH